MASPSFHCFGNSAYRDSPLVWDASMTSNVASKRPQFSEHRPPAKPTCALPPAPPGVSVCQIPRRTFCRNIEGLLYRIASPYTNTHCHATAKDAGPNLGHSALDKRQKDRGTTLGHCIFITNALFLNRQLSLFFVRTINRHSQRQLSKFCNVPFSNVFSPHVKYTSAVSPP